MILSIISLLLAEESTWSVCLMVSRQLNTEPNQDVSVSGPPLGPSSTRNAHVGDAVNVAGFDLCL